MNEDSNIYSSDSNNDYIESSEEIISLEKLQIKSKEKFKEIVIKNTNSNENGTITLEKIRAYIQEKNYDELQKYIFPYMKLSQFNDAIFRVTIKEFRLFFFYCPLCQKKFRQYSIPFHIFQCHFKECENYLNQKEIANCLAILMNKEYKKIDQALKIYSDLAVVFNKSEYKGNNEEIFNADYSLRVLKKLNIEKEYLNISIEQAKINLSKILPINKNKNRVRN